MINVKSMALSKTAVTPVLMHWSYRSLALSHQSGACYIRCKLILTLPLNKSTFIGSNHSVEQHYDIHVVSEFQINTKPISSQVHFHKQVLVLEVIDQIGNFWAVSWWTQSFSQFVLPKHGESISMAKRKMVVSQAPMHWRYHSFGLSYWCEGLSYG